MTNPNPFAAAQKIILSYLALIPKDEDAEGYAQCIAAYRVLEAAGGFTADDKERITKAIDQIPYYTPISDYKCPGKVLRDKFTAFLEALPDKPEKEK